MQGFNSFHWGAGWEQDLFFFLPNLFNFFSISANVYLEFKTLHKMGGGLVGFLCVLINGIMNDYGYVGFGWGFFLREISLRAKF